MDFDGNIAVAQLGNAGLGLVSLLVALAFVARWGRQVPRWLLALGAGVALLSGLAGALVVATSLTGLREDHGQWGIDSLVLGVAPLGAWFLLTRAALRDLRRARHAAGRVSHAAAHRSARRPGLRRRSHAARRFRALTARGHAPRSRRPLRRSPGPAGAPLSRAAAACVAYGGLKLHWALGGEVLMRQSPLPPDAMRDMLERDAASVASHWATVALALVGVALATRARGPRWLLVGLPALLCALDARPRGLRHGERPARGGPQLPRDVGPRAVVAVLRRLGRRMGVSRTGPQPRASVASVSEAYDCLNRNSPAHVAPAATRRSLSTS